MRGNFFLLKRKRNAKAAEQDFLIPGKLSKIGK
jgi:hypothetical protein